MIRITLLLFALAACGPKTQTPDEQPEPAPDNGGDGDGDGDGDEPADAEWTVKDLEAAISVDGCADVSDCDKIAVGKRLCGGPASYMVYCKTTTKVERMQEILEVVNKKAAAAADEQAKQGLAGTCVVTREPSISLENGTCVGN